MKYQIPQDLHMHTTWSHGDRAIVPQQTVALIDQVDHALIRGISDHFEYVDDADIFERYSAEVHKHGFYAGCEINSGEETSAAMNYPFDYYIFHCRDRQSAYDGAENLLSSGKPVILSHPMHMGADLNRVPEGCYLEINNRYIWRNDFQAYFRPHLDRFKFVFGSDAHQPHWLNQIIARQAAEKLGVQETLIFPKRYGS